jgi:hypothetical protein
METAMIYPAVIFVLLVVAAVLAIEWRVAARKCRNIADVYDKDTASLSSELAEKTVRIAILEAEIQRIRVIPLTPRPEKVDNSVIRAKSPAQVRQITEAVWGKRPESGEADDNE